MSFIDASHVSHYGWELSHSQATSVWSITVATLLVGAVFGSLPIGYVSSKLGRKRGLYFSVGLTAIASSLAIASFHVFSFELFVVSRCLTGFSVSLSLGLAAMFLSESSPKACRGSISMMISIFAISGGLYGATVGMPVILGNDNLWWYLFLNELIILLFVLAALPFIPESPGYLLLQEKESDAREAIMFFHGCGPQEVETVLYETKESLKQSAKTMSVSEVFKDKDSRRGTFVGMTVSVAVCFSGSSVMDSFAVKILEESGLSVQNASFGNMGLVTILLVASIGSALVIDRFGRRPLLLISNGAVIIINIIIFMFMFFFQKYKLVCLGYCLVTAIALFEFFFSVGIGPLSYFIGSEMVTQSARGVSQSCATLSHMMMRALILFIFLPLSEAIGQAFTYLILSVLPMVLTFLYLFFNMPETKNRSYREIIEATEKLPSIGSLTGKERLKH